MNRVCADCGQTFDERRRGTWREVSGWAVERTAGGTNAIRLKRETGRVICPDCGRHRDLGLLPGQRTLGL